MNAIQPARARNMQFLRSSNRAAIIKRLATGGAVSRIVLASELGLTKMAVSNIVAELMEEQLVVESGILPTRDRRAGSSGRKPTALSLAPRSINGIAVWITRYQLHCLAIEITGQAFCHLHRKIPPDADNAFIVKTLISMISHVMETNPELSFLGIGIASIGPLDIRRKMILSPPNFCNISNLELGTLLERHFHCPVVLDNDMNGIALAEQLYGVGRGMTDLVYVGFGTGVGAGVVANGKILHGNGGFAGELGHISVNPNGPRCSCGQHGCLELYTSAPNLLRECGLRSIRELCRTLEQQPPPEHLVPIMRAYREAVQRALISVANLFDPEIIIVGDQMLPLLAGMLPDIEQYMNTHMFHHGSRDIRIVPSSFGIRAPLIGAGAILFQKVFNSEIPLPVPE